TDHRREDRPRPHPSLVPRPPGLLPMRAIREHLSPPEPDPALRAGELAPATLEQDPPRVARAGCLPPLREGDLDRDPFLIARRRQRDAPTLRAAAALQPEVAAPLLAAQDSHHLRR